MTAAEKATPPSPTPRPKTNVIDAFEVLPGDRVRVEFAARQDRATEPPLPGHPHFYPEIGQDGEVLDPKDVDLANYTTGTVQLGRKAQTPYIDDADGTILFDPKGWPRRVVLLKAGQTRELKNKLDDSRSLVNGYAEVLNELRKLHSPTADVIQYGSNVGRRPCAECSRAAVLATNLIPSPCPTARLLGASADGTYPSE